MRCSRAVTVLLLSGLLAACGSGSSDVSAGPADEPGAIEESSAPTTSALPSDTPSDASSEPAQALVADARLVAFLAAGLDWSYGVTPDAGTIEVVRSDDAYGHARWTGTETTIDITYRFAEDEWEWSYVDEGVASEGGVVTEDELTAEETAAVQALGDAVAAAIGETPPAALQYAWKKSGGPSHARLDIDTADGPASFLMSADAEHRINSMDVFWPGF